MGAPQGSARDDRESCLFHVGVDKTSTTLTLTLCGELDIATAGELREHLVIAESSDVRTVVIDFDRLTFFGTVGLSLLVLALRRARVTDQEIVVRNADGQARRLFELSGVADTYDLALS